MTRVGPGRPATSLIEVLDVGPTQKAAAPTGKFVSGEPVATIVSWKHARRWTSVQAPLRGSFAVQSELLPHARMPSPFARTRPSQYLSSGPVAHSLSPPPMSEQMPPVQSLGFGGVPFGPSTEQVDGLHGPPA